MAVLVLITPRKMEQRRGREGVVALGHKEALRLVPQERRGVMVAVALDRGQVAAQQRRERQALRV